MVFMLITLGNELHTAEMPKVSSHVDDLVVFNIRKASLDNFIHN
jgi:hypothetical protein